MNIPQSKANRRKEALFIMELHPVAEIEIFANGFTDTDFAMYMPIRVREERRIMLLSQIFCSFSRSGDTLLRIYPISFRS